jgi:hypothetical protein
MTRGPNDTVAPDAGAPEPSPRDAEAPATSSEEAVGHGRVVHERDFSEAEEQLRDVDPHPDTPDDFDDDASSARESIEAVHDAGGDADDD